ncbi:MAG TPA: protein kinase [Polyangiaceae bacterium]|nr:protein kinase [Polyangiaceae bacterium]
MSDYREFQDGEVVPGTRYQVLRLIGAGGMGRVYEVEHVELGKRFVLKALQRELSRRNDLVARLRNEWRALARLEHPNIVNVTDAGTSDTGVPFYVMERLEGETLAQVLHRYRRLLPQHALPIAAGILEGLHAAHQIGVVHRDVKPPNIFLTGPTSVKVLDFGIAKIKDAKDVITARGLAVGTPRYMSPEQAQGTGVDARSDIYATGLMLFEMVSGVGPFDDAKDHSELLLAHLGRKAPLLSSLSVVAPELDAIVAAMLAKDPRERPGNARQVADTLRALAERYASYAGTETPTLNATPRPRSSEPPTRIDGPRAAQPAGAATRPDGIAGARRAVEGDTTTLQPALEIATTLAQPLVSASVTQRLPDALPTPSFYGSETLIEPISKAPTAVPGAEPVSERTERLLAVPPAPGEASLPDPGPTRTAVPVVEAPNVTPPPVVPSASLPPPRPARRGRGAVAVVAGALVAVAAIALLRPRSSSSSAPPRPAAAIQPAAAPAVPASAPAGPTASPVANVDPVATESPVAVPTPVIARNDSKKIAGKAPVAPALPPPPRPAPKARLRAEMPSSGL